MFYDLFGQEHYVQRFEQRAGGLSTQITNASGVLTASTSPRFTGLNSLPSQLLAAAPPVDSPQTAPQISASQPEWTISCALLHDEPRFQRRPRI